MLFFKRGTPVCIYVFTYKVVILSKLRLCIGVICISSIHQIHQIRNLFIFINLIFSEMCLNFEESKLQEFE